MINYIQFYFTQFNTKISLRAILGQQGLKKKNNSSKLLTDFPSRKSVKTSWISTVLYLFHLCGGYTYRFNDSLHDRWTSNYLYYISLRKVGI